MAARLSPSGRPEPVHAFKPTSGTALGSVGLTVAVVVVVLVLVGERSLVGLQTGLVAALLGLVVWMVLLRPRVTAYADTLVLRNMASDVHVPLASIDDVGIRHTLNVHVGERRYSCAGIGRSTRSMVRAQRAGGSATEGHDYVTFVETTIEDLARSARRDAGLVGRDAESEQRPVRRTWAVPELAGAALLILVLAVTFAL